VSVPVRCRGHENSISGRALINGKLKAFHLLRKVSENATRPLSRRKTHTTHVLKSSARVLPHMENGGKQRAGGRKRGKLSLPIATACPQHEPDELWPTPRTKKSFWPTVCCSSCSRTDVDLSPRIVRSRQLWLRFSFGLRLGFGQNFLFNQKAKKKTQKLDLWGVAPRIRGVEISLPFGSSVSACECLHI